MRAGAFATSNPKLVYARVSGYGQTGPNAQLPGYASVCEAYGGFRHVNGFPGQPPVRPNISLGDTLAGFHAAFGVLLALLERTRPRSEVAMTAPADGARPPLPGTDAGPRAHRRVSEWGHTPKAPLRGSRTQPHLLHGARDRAQRPALARRSTWPSTSPSSTSWRPSCPSLTAWVTVRARPRPSRGKERRGV